MPSGISHLIKEGGFPLEGLVLKLGLGEPENEVCLVLLVFILFNALSYSYCQILLVVFAEDVVSVQLGSIEVYVSACLVGIALFKENADHVDVLGDQVRGRFNNVRSLDVQLGAV